MFAAPDIKQKKEIKMDAHRPKQLRHTGTGRIFTYTDALASRPDMVRYPPATTSGLVEPDEKMQLIEVEYNGKAFRMDKKSVKGFNEMAANLEDLKIEKSQLEIEVAKLKFGRVPEQAKEIPPGVSDKMTITKAIEELMIADNKKDFSRNGIPKVGAIERVCGYDVSAIDRDDAWEAFKK
jgi:hypothetical protein